MILHQTNDLKIYTTILKVSQVEGLDDEIQLIVDIIKITKEDIPENFYISCDSIWDAQKKEESYINFIIKLNNCELFFMDNQNLARKYFKILNSDFENINLKEKYPELFI